MAVNWVLPVRGLQAVLAVTVLGMMAYVASWWTSHWRQLSPSEVNWMIFSPVWTILVLVPLILVPLKFDHMSSQPAVKWGLLVAEALTMLYWFGGFIALAVFLSDRICFGTVCSVAKAGTAIAAFEWVAFAVTAVFSVLRVVKGGRKSGGTGEPKVEMHQGV
ncbi:hypothetical protein EJ04DRAFT_227638 [Polyplosphaeria fusca]|uniref:MARVEL domain-containing protein n=1 Tax=Polyplosphaeria fusca TaxID=682080 RepID=A0A9P4R133_9PLEO|nr:hypothetical protein EJ04DRAFT_227638 [Polyplosphaeria fusca]